MAATENQSQGSGIQRELDTIKQHVNYEPVSFPGQEWRAYPEVPTARDLNPDWNDPVQRAETTRLLPNTWQRPWCDKNAYLETHYRLQREEAITMLRYSVKKFRDCPLMIDDEETCVYTKVFIRGYLMTRLGPMCRIQFSTERSGKNIRWSQTRRLTTGSLVVLSTPADTFRTICIPAVIADHPIRDGLDQNPPTIQIHWANMDDAIMDPTLELVMIESRFGYFEAVRHCLVGLQQVAMAETRLDKYLVDADKSDRPAQYIKKKPQMNITSLVHHVPNSEDMSRAQIQQQIAQVRQPLVNCSVIDGIDNRLSPYTNLDNSQLDAIHRILTKELAIVQGPPGTGKTFTSVQALQVLLDSQQRGESVIIVAAQTNHAVDQILTHLIKRGFEVARLGGRSQNEDIKKCSMYNLRRRVISRPLPREDRDYKSCESARKRNTSVVEKIVEDIFPLHLIEPQALQDAGIISEQQFNSLEDDEDWGSESETDVGNNLFSEWLGDQLVEVPPMDLRDPVFDDPENDDTVDLEDEDHQMDPDDFIADDDENRGRINGKWVPINHRWTGSNPHLLTENDLVIRRELEKPNLWEINPTYRGAVYQYWQRQLLSIRNREFRGALADNARICKNLKINRWYKDTQCIKSSRVDIIGCTTTGLCKYRGLLSALRPRTMLIEEAAETREANIMSALYSSLQQLILVGDHQQLAPNCGIAALGEEPYYLRVSMFERLVKLNMPFSILNMQRRMSPVLREVLNPFYPALQDHPVVTKEGARPSIPGMMFESFFFHHTWSEGTDENMSKFNILEAEMMVHFVNYLLLNGVEPAKITILTFYRGQRKKIMSEMRKNLTKRSPSINVQTVDSYQGEENDIILLSLVRSNGPNGPHKAGFLRDANRGVVAISRARRGFYVFGNMINLANACPESLNMWGQVQKVFMRQNRYGGDSLLPITCQQHGNTSWIAHPEQWINHHGGCTLPCADVLTCGHPCGRRCHWVDHGRLICQKPCERTLPCGHRCQQVCGEKCLCTCHAFTGAYPNDEAWDEKPLFNAREDESGQDGSYEMSLTSSSRRRGSRSGLRGRGGGRARASINNRTSKGRKSHLSRIRTDDAPGYVWSNFDAQQDDARRRKAKQQRHQQGKMLPGASIALSSDQYSEPTGGSIHETYRPVTLSHQGTRNVGGGIVSGSGRTPSPEKLHKPTLEPISRYTPQVQGQMSSGNVPSLGNMYQTENSVYPHNEETSASRRDHDSTLSLDTLSLLDEGIHPGDEKDLPLPVMGSLRREQHYTASTVGDMTPLTPRAQPTLRAQGDHAEWEVASTVNGELGGNNQHHGGGEGDLINF